MPTIKPPYKGDGAWTKPKDFSDKLFESLRSYYPDQQAETDPTWGHPADEFVGCILNAARYACEELHWQKFEITNSEIRAECEDLLCRLNDLSHKLRSLSPDFDRLLGISADPLGCAGALEALIGHVQDAVPLIDELPIAERPIEKQHRVLVEMAIRVLQVLKNYDIAPAATAGTYLRLIDITESKNCGTEDTSQYVSAAVEILKLIGDDIGLVRSKKTWLSVITDAKKNSPDLR